MNLEQDQEMDKLKQEISKLEAKLLLVDEEVDAAKSAFKAATQGKEITKCDRLLQDARAEQTNIINLLNTLKADKRHLEKQLNRDKETHSGEMALLKPILAVIVAEQWAFIKPGVSKSTNTRCRIEALDFYGVEHPENALPEVGYCNVLGRNIPMKYLCCSHIFPRRWAARCPLIGLDHIDSPANLMFLLKPIECAFDEGALCFVFDSVRDKYICHILDPKLKNKDLISSLAEHYPDNLDHVKALIHPFVKFGDLHLKELTFLNNVQPMKRCVGIMALVARYGAIQRGWLNEGDLPELDRADTWSVGYMTNARIEMIKQWRNDVASE